MIVTAGNGCYLTQSADVPMSERRFVKSVSVGDMNNFTWKEITESAKDAMQAEAAVIDTDNMSYESIKRVDGLLGKIAAGINSVPLTTEQAIELTGFYPEWTEGEAMPVGRRVKYGGTLYEVLQEHTSQADWTPDAAVSLWKVVQVEATGTKDDPIAWQQGMELTNGLYYTEGDVLYLCSRDSGIAMHYALADLVGNYVEIVG